jgi:hypothetical protein
MHLSFANTLVKKVRIRKIAMADRTSVRAMAWGNWRSHRI